MIFLFHKTRTMFSSNVQFEEKILQQEYIEFSANLLIKYQNCCATSKLDIGKNKSRTQSTT